MKTGRGRHGALFLESHAPLDEVSIGANHERGFVPRFGFRITPGPHFPEGGQPLPVQFAAALDAPGVLMACQMAFPGAFHGMSANFFKPAHASFFPEGGRQFVRHVQHVIYVVQGVGDHGRGKGAPRPVRLLGGFAQGDAVEVFHQGGQSELAEAQQARRRLRIPDHGGQRFPGVLKEAHVVVRAVHPDFRFFQPVVERPHVFDGERVDQAGTRFIRVLDQADFFLIAVQAVCLQIQDYPSRGLCGGAFAPFQ